MPKNSLLVLIVNIFTIINSKKNKEVFKEMRKLKSSELPRLGKKGKKVKVNKRALKDSKISLKLPNGKKVKAKVKRKDKKKGQKFVWVGDIENHEYSETHIVCRESENGQDICNGTVQVDGEFFELR